MRKKCAPRKAKGGIFENIKKPKGKVVNKMSTGGPYDEDVTVGSAATTDGGSTQDNSNGGGKGEKGGGISAAALASSIKGLGSGIDIIAASGGKKKKTGKDVASSATGMMSAGAGIGSLAGPIGTAIGAGAGLAVGFGVGAIDKAITNKKIAKATAKAKAELVDSYSKSLINAKLASTTSYSLDQSKLNGVSLGDIVNDKQLTDQAQANYEGFMATGGVKVNDVKKPKGRAIVNGMKDGGSKNYKLKQDKKGNVLGPNGKPLATGAVTQPLIDPIDFIAGAGSLIKNAGKLGAKEGVKALTYSKNKIIAGIASPIITQSVPDGADTPLTYKPKTNSKGGEVVGPGGPKEDKVAAKIPNGSFVVPAENAHIATAIRSMVLGDKGNKKASVNTSHSNKNVNLSDGEHVFTPKEVKKITAKGIDLNQLAPNAATKLDNGIQSLAGGGVKKKYNQAEVDKDASTLSESNFKKKYKLTFAEYNKNKVEAVKRINGEGTPVIQKTKKQSEIEGYTSYGVKKLKEQGASEAEIKQFKQKASIGLQEGEYSYESAFKNFQTKKKSNTDNNEGLTKAQNSWKNEYTKHYHLLEKMAKESGIKNPTSKDVLAFEKKMFSFHKPTFGKGTLSINTDNLTQAEQQLATKYFDTYQESKKVSDANYEKYAAVKKLSNATKSSDFKNQGTMVKQLADAAFGKSANKTTSSNNTTSTNNNLRSVLKGENPKTVPAGNPNIPTVTLDKNGNAIVAPSAPKTGTGTNTGTGKRLPKKANATPRETFEPMKSITIGSQNDAIDKGLKELVPTATPAKSTFEMPKEEPKSKVTFASISDALGGPAGMASLGQMAVGLIHSEATQRPIDHVSPELMVAYKDAIATKTQLSNEADYGLGDKVKVSAKNEIEANRLQAMNDIVAVTSGQGSNAALRQLAQDKNKAIVGLEIADAETKLKKKQIALAAGEQIGNLANAIDQRRRKIFEDESTDYQQNAAASANLINAGLTNFVNNLAYQKGEKDRQERELKWGTINVLVPNPSKEKTDNPD